MNQKLIRFRTDRFFKGLRVLLCILLLLLSFSMMGISENSTLLFASELPFDRSCTSDGDSAPDYLVISASTTIIKEHAFSGCADFSTLYIPSDVTAVRSSAFERCTNLKAVFVESDETVIHDGAFSSCSPELIIYGYTDDSRAKEYAVKNNIPFVAVWTWSDWTTAAPSPDVKYQKGTQYRSRSISTQTVYSDWSDWISNGTASITANDLREVKTVNHAAVTKTIYNYNRYKYKNASGTTYLSYSDGYANSNGFSGAWEYHSSETKLPNYKVYDGSHQAYGTSSSFWFNETKTTQTVIAAYTEYQYRTRTSSEETVYGNWSSWGTAAISPSSSIQVETRTVYRTLVRASQQPGTSAPETVENGMYVIRNAAGKALHVDGMKNAENTSVLVMPENGGNGQKFIVTAQDKGYYLIQIYDGPAVSFSSGDMQLKSVTGSSNQIWRFVPAGNNSFYIESSNFGYMASDSDGSMWLSDNLDDADQWTFSPTSLTSPTVELENSVNLTVGSITETSAVFTWTDIIGVDSYRLHISRDGNIIYTESNASSGFSLSSLSQNTTYTARLEAINSLGSGFTAWKSFTTKSNAPVVEFTQTSITVNENLAFNVGVKVTNYNNKSLKISLNTTDPKLDIIETKFTGPNQTLKTLYQAGIIKLPGSGHSNTADLQNTKSRTFYLSSSSGTLHIGGNYIRTSDTVTLTLTNPSDGSYTVGANSTCVIRYNDVDVNKPSKSNYSTKAAYVAACATWLNAKFPSGKYWNHPVGTICDDDNITSVSCNTRTHGSDNTIYSTSCFDRGVKPGDSICTRFAHYSSAQCMGFALKVGYDIFGSSPMNTTYWTNLGATSSLQPGDYVRVTGHSMFVLSVSGSKITTVECNRGANCIIHRNTRTVSGGYIDGSAIEQVRRIKNWK